MPRHEFIYELIEANDLALYECVRSHGAQNETDKKRPDEYREIMHQK